MERPTGSVTFLFTDIEGSTRGWEADPESMRASLARHDEVLRSAIEDHDGWMFKHTGDGVCAAFQSSENAVRAAIRAQLNLDLAVRMGIGAGEAESRDDDYFGPVLNRTARVMSAGHGGQILLAEEVAAIVRSIDTIDLGRHRLRDLTDPVTLHQVVADGLAVEFGALRTISALPGNLDPVANTFIGRERLLADVCDLLADDPLVTLTGTGGVGKTRLAMQCAASVGSGFPDGVWVVELAAVRDSSSVPDLVASTLNITARPGSTVTESIADTIRGQRLLIVLDNCEHVLAAAGDLAEVMARAGGSVRVLATSREAMQIPAEQVVVVPPLALAIRPDSEAVALFIERARGVAPDYNLRADAELVAVAEICDRLDGLPLALELASARVRSMTVQEILDRLQDRFRLLKRSGRGDDHHQTLRQTVAWSYDILDDTERHLLEHAAVFADGFDLDAMSSVVGGLDEYEVLDVLDSLVRKSLVVAERLGGTSRYGLLETIRTFAFERLEESGRADHAHERHAAYYASTSVERWDRWNGRDQLDALDWVDREYANLRSAFLYSRDHGSPALAGTIAAHATMLGFPLMRFEAIGWAEEIIALEDAEPFPHLPRVYTAAALCGIIGHPELSVERARRAKDLERDDSHDGFDPAWSGMWTALGYRYTGDMEGLLEYLTIMESGGTLERTIGLGFRLSVLPGMGRPDEARSIVEATLDAARATENPYLIAYALNGEARAYADVDPQRAVRVLQESLVYARDQRLDYFESTMLRELAALARFDGDHDRSLEMLASVVESFYRAGNHGSVATTLMDVGALFARIGRLELAAAILGASTQHGLGLAPGVEELRDDLRAQMGVDEFEACYGEGAAMDYESAMEFARREIRDARRELSQT